MKKKYLYYSICLFVCLLLGLGGGKLYNTIFAEAEQESHPEAVGINFNSLEEELWGVDLIIRGIVREEQETRKQDAGIKNSKGNFSFDVTPATVQVKEVIFGDAPIDGEITLLQHGSKSSPETTFVSNGEEVILLLTKTSWGEYWSYNFENGIWKVKDGKVTSKSFTKHLKSLTGVDVDLFKQKVRVAAEKKVKSPLLLP